MYSAFKQNSSGNVPTVVTVEWLKENLKNPDLKLIDGSFHMDGRDAKAEYQEKHIPDAVFFNIKECADFSSPYKLPIMLPSPEVFEEYVGERGISNSSHVVVYDNHNSVPVFSAQRVWWTFACFGHTKVSVLEGGLNKWISAGGPVTNEQSSPKKETFKAKFRPELVRSYDDVVRNIETGEFQLVDARPPALFNGTASEPSSGDKKPSHIPRAVNIPFAKLMDMENKAYRSAEDLAKLFKDHNVDLAKPITFTCASGLQASNLAMAAHICGSQSAAVYDGSWAEWSVRAPDNIKEAVPSGNK